MELLIVDDHIHMRKMLGKVMLKIGHQVTEAANGQQALQLLQEKQYDLMLLDIHMPYMDGQETMRQACQLWPTLQIIVLTGNPTVENAITAIRANVVDYFIKPVDLLQLVASISRAEERKNGLLQQEKLVSQLHNVLKGLDTQPPPATTTPSEPAYNQPKTIAIPPIRLLADQRLVILASDPEKPIKLSKGETAVLSFLLQHPNQPHTCQQIVQHAFSYLPHTASEAENVIRPYISRLRQKLEQNSHYPQLIQTVRGRGYQFVSQKKNSK